MELLTKEKGFIADRKIAASVKAKMFAGNNFEQIEKTVNDWLNRQNIIVQHIGQSQCESHPTHPVVDETPCAAAATSRERQTYRAPYLPLAEPWRTSPLVQTKNSHVRCVCESHRISALASACRHERKTSTTLRTEYGGLGIRRPASSVRKIQRALPRC